MKLSIAPNGMIVTKHDPNDENNIELLMQVPIRHVSYTGADAKEKKLFAYISNDVLTKTMMCHLFKAKAGVWKPN